MRKKENLCSKCLAMAKQIDLLEAQNATLQTANTKMHIVLQDNGLEADMGKINDAEAICVEQLKKLKELSSTKKFSQEDAKILDILHQNLIRARGGKIEKDGRKATKKLTDLELLRLIK